MKQVFINDTVEIIVNEQTNEVHIRALNTRNPIGMESSLRIRVDDEGFDLTGDLISYNPTSFKGLGGFRLDSTATSDGY